MNGEKRCVKSKLLLFGTYGGTKWKTKFIRSQKDLGKPHLNSHANGSAIQLILMKFKQSSIVTNTYLCQVARLRSLYSLIYSHVQFVATVL